MSKYFSDPDDFIPRKLSRDTEDLQNYLLEHSYYDGIQAPADEKVLFYNGVPIGSRGNIIAINGKAKSRKSVIASAIMSSAFIEDEEGFLGFTSTIPGDPRILNFDTEQGLGHWIDGSRRVINDAGLSKRPEGFYSHHTRDCDVDKRIALFEYALRLYRPDIAVLDGITDVVYDLNSQEEATKIGGKLMQWSVEFNCLIVCIIHITKGTGYMTGALGTYLEKKCQTALKCEKDEKDESVSWVACQYARDKGFQAFSIQFDDSLGRYTRGNETKEMRSSVDPSQASEELKRHLLTQIFTISQAYQNERAFQHGIMRAGGLVGVPNIVPKHARAWQKYYTDGGFVLPDADGRYLRAEVIQAALAASPEFNFSPPSEDHASDDLPF